MMFFMSTLSKGNTMYDFEEANAILAEAADAGIVERVVEPIDDPSIPTDFYDWADVVGVTDQIEPETEWK